MNTILESNKVTTYLCLYKMKQEKKGKRIITTQTSSSDNESIKLVVYILEISFLKPQNYVFYNKMWQTIGKITFVWELWTVYNNITID